jgi:hypothetical protein
LRDSALAEWREAARHLNGDAGKLMAMGYKDEAMRRIKGMIERASRIDATLKLYDLDGTSHSGTPKLEGGKANDMHWGKAFWVLEQLRAQEPEVLARYFRAKRQLAKPGALARMRPTRPSRR